jgi:hypothetical protein
MKRKLFALILLFSCLSVMTFSQVTDAEKTLRTVAADTVQGWKKGGVLSLNLAQTSLTNWSAGGQKSFAINGLLSTFANYKRGKTSWVNSLDIGYGLLKQGSTGYRKTDDKFDLLSKYGYEAFKNFYYAALLNFKTQMTPGWKYNEDNSKTKISNLFAPAYLLAALGLDFKPTDHFSAFIAPLTGKITFVTDKVLSDAGAFGVKPGENTLSEFGGYIRAIYTRNNFKNEFLKNVTFTTKVDLFSNYIEHPENIVVNWETLIAFKVNKYISASISTQLIYDDKIKVPVTREGIPKTIGSLVQFKEILGVGFSYNF